MNSSPPQKNLRQNVASGLAWTYAERLFTQGVSLVVSIVLARMLSPDDYGIIAIVIIFITILNVFVTSGLGNSLVQKKSSDATDFSTACYSGLVISIFLYVILFLCAPFIAEFYNMELLTPLIRVLGIRIPIASINSIQQAYVSKHMIFRKFFDATLFGTLVSAFIGIFMAYNNFGAWALVAQYLTNTIINTIVLFVILPWRPQKLFSFQRFKELYSYGWKILLADLLQTVYNDLRSLAIGKKYTSADLAYYDRGQQFTSIIVTNINVSIINVLFPAISKYQDDLKTVKNMTRRAITVSSYVMSPLLIGLAITAEPVILLLLTEKWISVVPYLQILCVANLFQPMHSANLQAIKAIGRSDINLILEIIKKIYTTIILIISIVFFNDPFAVAVGFVLSTFISLVVNAFPNKKLLNYGYIEQLKDIEPNLIMSIIMGIAVWGIGLFDLSVILRLFLQISAGGILYIVLSIILKNESYKYMLEIIKSFLKRKT